MQHHEQIQQLIGRVRARWRALQACRAAVRAALAAAAVVGLALVAARGASGSPLGLVALAAVAAGLGFAGLAWGLLPLRDVPDDRQVARFIEEREPALDDRLVSAVDVALTPTASVLAEPMLADAARRVGGVPIDAIVPAEALRRAGFQAAAAALVLIAVLVAARGTARQALDAASLTLFPARVALEVTPGNARIKAGTAMAIRAHLVGNRAPVIAQLQIADGDLWRTASMVTEGPGAFRLALDPVAASFKYRIVAGAVTSPTYEIVAAHPPRVARIDVDYTYPAGLGLKPRTDRDSGDIYAPAGTDVRIHILTDRPAAAGRMALGNGQTLSLTANAPTEFSAGLKVTDDSWYRVALAGSDGLSNDGDTEYFIRMLEDRPPEVRILKPATDRAVTRLEEVDVEAQAEDDYGIDRMELVYAVRGGPEHAVPLPIARGSTTVDGRHTLYLEDLNVQPGDFIAYYVRARDLTRGTRPSEARSDIFFLEVKPYEQEFVLAQSQSSQGAGGGRSAIDDLVAAQKDIIVATWKLDRRTESAKGAKSEQDIRSVSRAESELQTRVEQASSAFRESTMRDPRRRAPQRGGRGGPPPPEPLKAGQTLPEEDEMGAAVGAMARAVTSLDALQTGPARAPEMEALDHLLKAQADVKRREVTRQQAGSGAGNNRSNVDISTLFDKELQKNQQTNYENRSGAEQHEDPNQSALDKVRELARRQDELLKRQQDLARSKLSEEELKRELEKLTREQADLRQRAEELARKMNQPPNQSGQQSPKSGQSGQQSSTGQQNKSGQQAQSGQQGQPGQQGQQGQQGQPGQQGQQGQSGQQAETPSAGATSSSSDTSQRMRDISEEMRSATNDLRRQDPNQASARGSRALDKLRELERQLDSERPDEKRRALGEMQLEARQLADAQRQIASELGKTPAGDAGKDGVRRLAGEEERLADRARKLENSLKQQAGSGAGPKSQTPASDPGGRSQGSNPAATAATAADAAKELDRQHVADRMRQSAEAMRGAADRAQGPQRGTTAPASPSDDAKGQAGAQQEVARALDKLADRLGAATGARDGQSQKLSEQRARAQELRDTLNNLTSQLDRVGKQSGQRGQGGSRASSGKTPGESGRAAEGQQGGGGGSGTDLARLREQYQRALQETRDLVDQVRREDPNGPTYARGGLGFTFEGQGMTLSAPGTEAFKQDFAKWDDLRRQATQALENAETSLSKKLQASESRDRLAAGADDKAPPEYRQQVDSYFKAIAKKKG